MNSVSRRWFGYDALLLIGFACAGCQPSSSVAPVSGKVLLDGQPLATGAIVTLPPAGRGAKGAIQNGNFTLGTFQANDGATIGTHKVAVLAYEAAADAGPESLSGKLLVPQRYTNPETSELTIEVVPGANSVELKLSTP